MNTPRLRNLALLLVVTLVVGGMLACDIGGETAKPTITITAPTSDAQFEEGEEVNVLSSANDAKGIVRVELYVDTVLYRTDSSPNPDGEKSLAMVQTWTATDPGRHTLSVTAYNVDGAASDPWAVTIVVVEAGGGVTPPTPTTSTAPPPAATNTPPPPPPPTPTEATGPSDAPSITYFRANGAEGSITVDAGTTVTLSWEWERVEEGFLDPGNMPMACPSMPCTYDVAPDATTTYTLRAVNSLGTIEAHVTVQIAEEEPLPDLVLDGLSVAPRPPVIEGASVEVNVDVINLGDAPSGPYTVVWRYGAAGPDYCQWDKTSLPPMNGGTLHCTVEMYESFNTVAEVDWEGNVDESDEDNNRMELYVEVVTEPLPDLYISEIRLDPASPQQGSPVHVGCRIHNGGTVDASGFKVIWRSAGPTVGCEWDGVSLASGAARWQQCEYTYSGWNPNYTTTCIVDADGEVDEIDEDNNELIHMVNVRPD
jgi:hypothetical protein